MEEGKIDPEQVLQQMRFIMYMEMMKEQAMASDRPTIYMEFQPSAVENVKEELGFMPQPTPEIMD